MAWVALLLALFGGLVLGTTFVADVDERLVAAAWVAWLTALVLCIVSAARTARAAGQSRRSASRSAAREAWEFVRDLMP